MSFLRRVFAAEERFLAFEGRYLGCGLVFASEKSHERVHPPTCFAIRQYDDGFVPYNFTIIEWSIGGRCFR